MTKYNGEPGGKLKQRKQGCVTENTNKSTYILEVVNLSKQGAFL